MLSALFASNVEVLDGFQKLAVWLCRFVKGVFAAHLLGFLGVGLGVINRSFFSFSFRVAIPSPVTFVPCNLNDVSSLRFER